MGLFIQRKVSMLSQMSMDPNQQLKSSIPEVNIVPQLATQGYSIIRTWTAINFSDIDFCLIDRNHIPYKFSAAPNIPYAVSPFLEHQSIYTFRGKVEVEGLLSLMSTSVAAENAHINSDTQVLYDALKRAVDEGRNLNNANVIIKRKINPASFSNTCPRKFFPDIDLLVDLRYDPLHSVHPHTTQGRKILRVVNDTPDNSLSITIDFIDNENKYSTRYISLMGKIYAICPRKDAGMASGVHFDAIIKNDETPFQMQKFIELPAEFSKVGLAASQEEAEGFSDTNGKRSEEIANIRHQRELEKLALQDQLAVQERQHESVKRQNEEAAAAHRLSTETTLREIRLNYEKELASLKRMQQEAAIAAESMSNELKLTKAKNEATLDASSMNMEQYYRQRKLAEELEHSKIQNNLTVTQTLAKSAPAIATGIVGTFLAMKLFDSHGGSGFSPMGLGDSW